MQMPTSDEVHSYIRHGVSVGGTILTIGSMLAFIPADKVQAAIAALQDLGTDLEKVFGDAAILVSIVGPALVTVAAKFAAGAVSLKSQVASIREAAPNQLIAAVNNVTPGTLTKAVSDLSPGTLAIATAALPGVQVTVSGDAVPALRTLAADTAHPDIVKASLTAPAVAPPVARVQKE